jgi:hypothetical protein
MTSPRKPADTEQPERERKAGNEDEKVRIPAEPIAQRPDEPPIGNGGTDEPAAFPPHN